MILYLQLGRRAPAGAMTKYQPGLTEWVGPLGFTRAQADNAARECGVPLLAAAYPEPLFGNARAYRQVHLEQLAALAGIDELLFDQGGYGLLASTPDVVTLRPEHVEEVSRARQLWQQRHPLAEPEHAGAEWPAQEPEPAINHQVLDLLLWLEFWMCYALDQFADQAAIGNFDWQYHPVNK